MDGRSIKYNFNYCKNGFLNLIDFIVKIDDMVVLEKNWFIERNQKIIQSSVTTV